MATQYTAGLTAGEVLTAATMNSIGAEWESWTPTITASAGAFTTTTVNVARYARIQKIIVCFLDVTINNVGTATGQVLFTLPFTARSSVTSGAALGAWREFAAVGITGTIETSTTTIAALSSYNNSAFLGSGRRYGATFIYEAA